MRRTLVLSLLVGACGCASGNVWVPEAPDARLPDSGALAVGYPMPAQQPGEVVLGVVDVTPVRAGLDRAVRVRVRLDNRSAVAWRVDPARQRLVRADGLEVAPTSARLAGREVAKVAVPPHAVRRLDLTYAVAHEHLARFDVAWRVESPRATVAGRTGFRRETGYRYSPPLVDGYFYAPIYYAPPAFARFGFPPPSVRGPAPAQPRVRGRAHIVRPARPAITVSPPGWQ